MQERTKSMKDSQKTGMSLSEVAKRLDRSKLESIRLLKAVNVTFKRARSNDPPHFDRDAVEKLAKALSRQVKNPAPNDAVAMLRGSTCVWLTGK
jgi:hypothetical protein